MIKRLIGSAVLGLSVAMGAVQPAAAAVSGPYGSSIQMPEAHCLLRSDTMGGTQTRTIEIWSPGVSLSPNNFINANIRTARWSTRIDVSGDSGATWSVWRSETYQDSLFAVSSNGYSTNGFRGFNVAVPVRNGASAFRVVAKFQFFDKAGRLLSTATPWYIAPMWTQWSQYAQRGSIWGWETILSSNGSCVL